MKAKLFRQGVVGVMCAVLGVLVGCSGYPAIPEVTHAEIFKPATKSDRVEFLKPADVALIEESDQSLYRIGAGDVLSMQVWGRPEISGRMTVGPDGIVSLPLVGSMNVMTLSREEAASHLRTGLERYYDHLNVTLNVDQYVSNRITVLGRVQNPGQLVFESQPTLLEVLARAGSLPVIDKQATLTRCAIFRGRDKIIWVDLKRLLNGGETVYNLRMKKGDLVYVPDSADTMIYVMGAVMRPGAYRLTPDMSVMDALMQAGGPNEDASQSELGVYRPTRQAVDRIELKHLLAAGKRVNFALEEGDVLFIPKRNIAEFGYITRQLGAGLSFLTFANVMASKP